MATPPPNLPGHPRGIKLVSARTLTGLLAVTPLFSGESIQIIAIESPEVQSPVAYDYDLPAAPPSLEEAYALDIYTSRDIVSLQTPNVEYDLSPTPMLLEEYQLDVISPSSKVVTGDPTDDGGLPTTISIVEESYDLAPVQNIVIVGDTPTSDDSLPITATGTPDEPYQHLSVYAQDEVTILSFPTGGSFLSTITTLVEEYRLDIAPFISRVIIDTSNDDDALPIAAIGNVFDIEYWTDSRPILPLWVAVSSDDDSYSAPISGSYSSEAARLRQQYGIGFKRWEFTEEFPLQVIGPGLIDDGVGFVPYSIPGYTSITISIGDEEIVPQPVIPISPSRRRLAWIGSNYAPI